MATTVWKGMLTFGLVSIPIRLYAAARTRHIQLHQLHKTCHTRVKQPLFCPTDQRMIERSEVVKGYEFEKGQYVLLDEAEVKKITPASSQVMEILSFVDENAVDPIYFDSSYLAVPEPQAAKAYRLLVKALADTKKVGIAKVTMHQREYTVFLRPRGNGLTLHTMYYSNEIAQVDEYGKVDDAKLNPAEIKLAEQLVETLAGDFKPTEYHDDFQQRLNELIEAKLEGKTVAAAPQAHPAPVIDIMEALKKSLASSGARKAAEPKPAAAPKSVPAAAARRRRKTG